MKVVEVNRKTVTFTENQDGFDGYIIFEGDCVMEISMKVGVHRLNLLGFDAVDFMKNIKILNNI